jgi:uncharacterized protein (DUF1330 family)
MAAFVIALIDVTDPEAYKLYTVHTPRVIQQYGGKFVVRGGAPEALEGELPASRFVVIEFADRAAAKRFYESKDYQEIVPLRQAAATGSIAVVDTI